MKFRVVSSKGDGDTTLHWMEPLDTEARVIGNTGSFRRRNGHLAFFNPDDIPAGSVIDIVVPATVKPSPTPPKARKRS